MLELLATQTLAGPRPHNPRLPNPSRQQAHLEDDHHRPCHVQSRQALDSERRQSRTVISVWVLWAYSTPSSLLRPGETRLNTPSTAGLDESINRVDAPLAREINRVPRGLVQQVASFVVEDNSPPVGNQL